MNTFEQMEQNNQTKQEEPEQQKQTGEIDVSQFSDTAVGEKIKYNRPDLDGKEDIIEMFQVFMPDTTQEPETSRSGNSLYWKPTIILTYASVNEDGVNNREYISGAKVFKNRDGTPGEVNFWYKDAVKESQSIYLWEQVAAALNVEPDKLSPREFITFLNSKPKCTIVGTKYENYNTKPGSPRHITKNMPKLV